MALTTNGYNSGRFVDIGYFTWFVISRKSFMVNSNFFVCKKLEIKFAYLAFVLFLKLSVRILGSLDFELYCQWQVIVSELVD